MNVTSEISLHAIEEKVEAEERLTPEEGLRLLETTEPEELELIRSLADQVRKRKAGDVVHFASTLFIHPSQCEHLRPLL